MDDTKTYVEFPIGDRLITVREPGESQLLMLMMTRAPKDGDTRGALSMTTRMFRLLEALTGKQYEDVIEDGLMTEEITVLQVVELIKDVAGFDWAGARAGDALQDALDREEAKQAEPAPVPKPGPRVVKHA